MYFPLITTNGKDEVYELLVLLKLEGLIEYGVGYGTQLLPEIRLRSILYLFPHNLR